MDFSSQINAVSRSVRHHLLSSLGKTIEEASQTEIFLAISFALRDKIMVNWSATTKTFNDSKSRRVYLFSMEYLPGRVFSNNLINLQAKELIFQVLKNLGRRPEEILAVESDPSLGNGGLGRLASCLIDSLATLKYPAFAYGLRYQFGIFEQQIWHNEQIEKPDCWLFNEYPWEYKREGEAKFVKYAGRCFTKTNAKLETIQDLFDYEEVRAVPYDIPIVGYTESKNYNVLTLRLWSTKESPHNFKLQHFNAELVGEATENTDITDVLYPNDHHDTGKRIRLKQEFLLVSASMQDIFAKHFAQYGSLAAFKDKVRIQLNDTHSVLILAEMIRRLMKHHDFSWKEAWETAGEVCSYTNHTILREALEEWNQERISLLLPRQYKIIEQINHELCSQIRTLHPGDEERVRRVSIIENGQVKMAHLALYLCHKVNGVSRLHGEILKKIFPDFFGLFPHKFTYITNGVSHRHWILHANPYLAEWITQKIGKGWIENFHEISKLKSFVDDEKSLKEVLEIKKRNKQRFIDFINTQNPIRDKNGVPTNQLWDIYPDSLFDVQAKRIHEYKRQLMNILHLIMLYFEMRQPDNKRVARTVVFSGKAAANYSLAKNIVSLAILVERTVNADPLLAGKLRVVFVENYNVSRAEVITSAADLSEQISTAGFEASGTGNMKFAMNGALTIGTEDGSTIELREAIGDEWWPFRIGSSADELAIIRKENHYNPWEIYHSNPKIKQALDSLKNGTFAKNEEEHLIASSIFDSLMLGYYGFSPDRFFVLKDLPNYYATQQKVDLLYQQPLLWAKTILHNLSSLGNFSSDTTAKKYADEIWQIGPSSFNEEDFKRSIEVYSQFS